MYTWKTVESADFVEHASYLVCDDLHHNLGVVQSNFREICNIAASWSENGQLDVFSPRDSSKSFSMDKLQEQHRLATNKTDLWKKCILKPWPNGLGSRRKWNTWVYTRLRLARALHFLWISSFIFFTKVIILRCMFDYGIEH